MVELVVVSVGIEEPGDGKGTGDVEDSVRRGRGFAPGSNASIRPSTMRICCSGGHRSPFNTRGSCDHCSDHDPNILH